MKALMYLTKQSFINNLKKALHKPVSLLLMIFLSVYAVFIVFGLGMLVRDLHFNSVKGLVIVVTLWTLYIFFANFLSYASRKGVIFRQGHTQFVFTAPISPKLVLLHSAWMNYITSVVFYLVFLILGITAFGVAPWKMVVFFLVCGVLEIVFECSIMVWLYTNEKLPEKVMKILCLGVKGFLAVITIVIFLYFRREGISLVSAGTFFDWPVLQMIPFVGWNICVYRLILLSPTVLNLTGTFLYLAAVVGMVSIAFRMKCDGGYYEEAARFADDYAEMKRKKNNGEIVTGIREKHRAFRKVKHSYRAQGAKAIFSRQLLEYRKEKYFIFSKMTLICLFFAAIFAYTMKESAIKSGIPQFFLLGIIAYISLVMSGYTGKWEKELKSPYLFLIPDKAYKKLWYATAMEHVKALLDGIVMCVPIGIAWDVHPAYIVQTILIYTALQANRLYMRVLAQCIVGELLGKTGQNIVRALMQMFILGIGIMLAVLIGVIVNLDLVFPLVLFYTLAVAVFMGLIASVRFDTMEQI